MNARSTTDYRYQRRLRDDTTPSKPRPPRSRKIHPRPSPAATSARPRPTSPRCSRPSAQAPSKSSSPKPSPPASSTPGQLTFGPALTEPETLAYMRSVASKNKVLTSLIGQGYYGTLTPAVIQRNILENPAWYTAYTPYQPEISQGRLEAIINFQTMVADLTGLDIANASLLDEATAAAEAMAMAKRGAKSSAAKSSTFFVDQNCHPQTIAVLETRSKPLGWTLVIGDAGRWISSTKKSSARSSNTPAPTATFDYRAEIAALHTHGAIASHGH